MYYNLPEVELRSECRTAFESLEMWTKRLIHEKMTSAYGSEYIKAKANEEYIFNKEIRNRVESRLKAEPKKYARPVDTLLFEHYIDILCHPKLYKPLFKEVMDYSYPEGSAEARTLLERLLPARHALAHANSISVRQAEQVICYAHDFIDGMKQYEKEKGRERVWNVPQIIRVTDSFGNTFDNLTDGAILSVKQELFCGDSYSATIEVDSSFLPSEYSIKWSDRAKNIKEYNDKSTYCVQFTETDIAADHFIQCDLISNKKWHKHQFYDCRIVLRLTVLPIENC